MNKVALVEDEMLFNGGDERAANDLVFVSAIRAQGKDQDKADDTS